MRITKKAVETALAFLKPYFSYSEWLCLQENVSYGEEKQYFKEKVIELVNQINETPPLYAQYNKENNAVVHLHYFLNASDWYILELEKEEGYYFGFCILNGDIQNAELGYILVRDLRNIHAELDFNWEKKTLGEVKKEKGIKV